MHCWSHLSRRFVKLARNSKSPIAEAAVRHIAQLYAIEAMVRGSSPDIRLVARREHSLPMVAALKPWFEKQLSMISSGSTLAEDIRYALNHWQGLNHFLEDGHLELDTNPVENAIRPVCLTRKNALFAGHDVGASYCSSDDVLIMEGDSAADPEISGDVIAWHQLRGTQCLAAGRRTG